MRESPIKRYSKAIIVILLLVWTLLPVYWMLTLATRASSELSGPQSFIQSTFSLEHFVTLFTSKDFGTAMWNSIQITVISLAFSLVFGLCCAYILARARFKFKMKGWMLFWVLILRVIPPIAFAMPLYILFTELGLLSTKVPIIFAHMLITIPFIIWFMISFFNTLPQEVEESATVDGASENQLFFRIVLPQVLSGITAVSILSFMTSWNEYLFGVIFVQSPTQFTIPLTLSTLNSEQELAQWGTIAAGGVMSLIPIAIFVLVAQNFLISGLSGGAVKE